MPMIVLDRTLENCSDSELKVHWHGLAQLLTAKRNIYTGELPPRYQKLYDDCREEFRRRGVQLQLFPWPPE